ncbi:putative two component sigma54 specific Fis family transcriptional regulator [Magnetofaba australis IT-1]|uniref:Putative two component sigma54 specific Fis family transcriptional regulator n=1 Tax=Magnetofaba australis IT-1 TaxID=1434232 RepID=A0A1Y2K656_9PROT|nr:putative two component sigma54 specific Fis family transcriptional regulator [Magnetofaba australis IT-1]
MANVLTLQDGRTLMDQIRQTGAACVVLDLTMPMISGLELLKQLKSAQPDIPVMVMTASQELDTAVDCMKEGAFDYLVKPVEPNRFISAVKHALELNALRNQVDTLRRYLLDGRLQQQEAFDAIVTCSESMTGLFRYMEAIARSQEPVLITGETGSGKELIAQALHELTGSAGKFVPVNVAGLDDDLFSDTLFGHRKGAYSSAENAREGLITQAAGGTLFLDEIGDLSHTSQVKLLRLLQDRQYYPLGSDAPLSTDARVLVATHRDLRAGMEAGTFRSDLYYRLSAHHVEIPPLRRRQEDIPLLLEHFLTQAAQEMGKKKPTPPPELRTLLCAYAFPGNIRELRAMVWDAVARHGGGVLSMNSFRDAIEKSGAPVPVTTHAESISEPSSDGLFTQIESLPSLKETENLLVDEAMRRAGDNQGIAAGMLGITRSALNQRLRKRREAKDAS